MSAVVKAYVTLIKNHVKAYKDVDSRYKDDVKQALIELGLEELIQES